MATTKQDITLEDITLRKEALQKEIREEKKLIKESASNLFAPVRPSNKLQMIMHSINSGIVAYDGILLGMKAIKRVRQLFRK